MPLKKWVANIASQHASRYYLFASYEATESLPLASTIAKLENILNRQEKIGTHHTFPKQHKTPPLEIINPDSANDTTANFHKEYETLFFSYLDKTILHTHEITKSRLSVALLALDTTLCGRPESPF